MHLIFKSLLGTLALLSIPDTADTIQMNKGDLTIALAPGHGGRIAQIYYKNQPLLLDIKDNEEYFGSVWWPSPQNDWIWPPPEAIDKLPYVTEYSDEMKTVLSSSPCFQTGLIITKEVQLLSEEHFSITYRATNTSEEPVTFGHWEVTRLPKEGRVIFPVGERMTTSIPDNQSFLYYHQNRDCSAILDEQNQYFDIDINPQMRTFPGNFSKLFADASGGWSAFLKDNILLVKCFPEVLISDLAPDHGEVEVYIASDLPFVELEQHGNHTLLPPNNTSEWQVHWIVTSVNHSAITADEIAELVNEKRKNYQLH